MDYELVTRDGVLNHTISSVFIDIRIINDKIVEDNEHFIIFVSCADPAVVVWPNTTLITVMDDDSELQSICEEICKTHTSAFSLPNLFYMTMLVEPTLNVFFNQSK